MANNDFIIVIDFSDSKIRRKDFQNPIHMLSDQKYF